MMDQQELIIRFKTVKDLAASNGITLLVTEGEFVFNDVPAAKGRVVFKTLEEVETFVYGYRFGYRSKLQNLIAEGDICMIICGITTIGAGFYATITANGISI